MQESDFLYKPLNDIVAVNEESMNKCRYSDNQHTLPPTPALEKLTFQQGVIRKKDLILSNNEYSISSTISVQETDSAKEEYADNCLKDNLPIENETTESSIHGRENDATFKKSENSLEYDTVEEKAFQYVPQQAQILQDHENLQNSQVLEDVNQKPPKRKRGRPPTKHLLKQQVLSENHSEVLRQNNQCHICLRKRIKIAETGGTRAGTMRLERREMPRRAQKHLNRYSTKVKWIKKDNVKAAESRKSKKKKAVGRPRQKVKISQRKASLRMMKKIRKKRGIKDVSQNENNFGPSRTRSTIKRPRRKKKINISDPIFHEPFKYGWRREVVYRAYTNQSRADVYYYSPEGEKLRSFVEIKKKLPKRGLTITNFTFYKGSIGINDPLTEIIRLSTRVKNINNHIGDTSKHVEKKELLLNHQSHVENPSFSESNSISGDNGLLDTNSNGNTLLENEYGRISDLPNLQYNFTQDCKTRIKDYESIPLNVSSARFSQDSISLDNIIENIKTSRDHAENLHKKNQESPSRSINIKENVSRNCNRLPIKDMNIKRKDLIEGSKLDDKITEVIEENCDIESSFPNLHKPYRTFLSPNINTNPITMEEKTKFFINNCSISVATETNNNNIMTKHNSIIIPIEEFRKILSNTVQQKHRHSLLSFFTAYDILKRIFNLLSIEDLLNAQKVCKMWNIFINEPTFWRKFILNNNQITDQIVDALIEHNTEHLIIHNDNDNWNRFNFIIKKIVPLKVLELCDCPGTVVSWVIYSCPQLTTIRALSITNEEFVLPYLKSRSECKVLQLQCVTTMTLTIALQNFMVFQSLTHLSLLTINNLTEQRFDFLYQLVNLEDLELGQFNGKVGTKTNDMSYPHLSFSNSFLTLYNLKRFRLENIKTLCFTRLLQIISKLKKLTNLELANITLTQEFEDHLHLCTNINRLLLAPNYETTPACSNTRILNSIYKLRKNLKHFIWDFSNESFQFSQTFCQQSRKYIPILSCQLNPNLTNIHLNDGSSLYNKKFKQTIKQLMNVACQDINYICNCWNIDAISSSSLQKFCNVIIPMTKVELLNIN